MEPTQAPMQHKSATKPILVMIIIVVLAIIFAIYLYGKRTGRVPFIVPTTSNRPLTPEDTQAIMDNLKKQNLNSQSVSSEDQAKIMTSFSTPVKNDTKDSGLSEDQAKNIFNTLNN